MNIYRGYIALFSVLIVCALLSITLISASTELYFVRSDVSEERAYRQSRATARACAYLAIHAVSIDIHRFDSALPLRFTIFNDDACKIVSSSVTSTRANLVVIGSSGQSVFPLRIIADRNSLKESFVISTWEELDENL